MTIIRDEAVYSLRFILNNSFNYYDPKVGSVPMHERGYNLFYASRVQEKISFKDKSYTNLEIHFTYDYLASLAPHFIHLRSGCKIQQGRYFRGCVR
ncbi:hypothetical protein [Paraflavitalea speifideaquila]|uniref:hypothetical protein n=1 Tax=Paraflavitalea speifideaquila TaxID=3076558 RepID=UPI0028E6FE4A|nr:hypothetical protein [Paraflavitalea speifideiaquila]